MSKRKTKQRETKDCKDAKPEERRLLAIRHYYSKPPIAVVLVKPKKQRKARQGDGT